MGGEVADPNGAGHTYFAAMESDGGQAPTFFDGETSSINTLWAALERLSSMRDPARMATA